MKAWTDLVTSALLGAERAAPTLPAMDGLLGEHLARIAPDDREQAILSAAALLGAYRRAGRLPGAASAPPPSECPPDVQPECRPQTAHLISMTLGKQYAATLPEALNLLASAKRRLPAILLPELLDAGRRSRAIRSWVQTVADRRGVWLAAQNPEWAYLVPEDTGSLWTDGVGASRLAYYTIIRARDAERARTLLAESWSQEGASDRAAFLGAWEDNLTLEDEPFLENALDDRSKEVRKIAANLLTRLPDSRRAQRMIARAEPLLSVHKSLLGKAHLEVAPPESCDAAMERDGIEKKPPQGEGEKAFWLRQIVIAVPIEFWTEHYRQSPSNLIALSRQNDWGGSLRAGWRWAARFSQNKDWLTVLIQDILDNDPAASGSIPGMMSSLLPDDFEALFTSLIENIPLSPMHPVLTWAASHDGAWSLEFSRLIARTIAGAAVKKKIHSSTWWSYTNLLSEIGRNAPPQFAEEFLSLWPRDHKDFHVWGKSVDEITQILSFRNALHIAISEENSPL
ncbi:hypothetical protein CCAX7_31750 [Capsulimonas corticalis]|uniref:Uncharacterized protein n=1 Tax=Capsulimonas corticalis TaxID=2219043 RepID=A0A402CSC9_9BACT|nr:DUF5691 domain-containing protein [Capsulimonas corticalis]BDI31124.1 hypothetical protein CCAX7_31750 [Capsulimonas corticalis]